MDPEALDELCAGLRSFLQAEVVGRHQSFRAGQHDLYDATGRYRPDILRSMREVRQASAAAGYFAALAPEEVGGGGLGFQALYRMWEAVFEFCGAEYWLGHQALSHWSRGPSHLYMAATPDLRAEILPDLLAGTTTTCFAMSEPDAGSDIWRMSTVARPVEGGWLLNGTKQWVTNSPYADWVLVFAVTDRALFQTKRGGLTGFVIPASSEGFRVDSVISMFGHAGGDEGILSFQEVFVPQRQVLGQPHDGLKLALSGVSMGRMYNSGRAVGMAKWALAKALAYAEDRVTFGRPLIENQAISFPLAESAMEVHAARLMGLDAARALDAGRPARALVSMSKAYSTETAVRALDRAVQVHGAMGFANETALSQAWQAMRRTCVADGSSEMMRVQIVKHLRSHGLAF